MKEYFQAYKNRKVNGDNYDTMQKCFDAMDDKQKIRMFYELTKYMHENMEYGEDDDMNNLMDDIANVKNDIENL